MRRRTGAVALLLAAVLAGIGYFGYLRVTSGSRITAMLKARMSSDKELKGSALNIKVKDGVATLSGQVPTVAARYEAFKLASETPGIKKVMDDVTVEESIRTTAASNSAASASESQRKPPIVRPHRAIRHARSVAEPTSASQVTAETPAPGADANTASASAVPAPKVNPAPVQPPGPPPERITIPTGTQVRVRMIDSISSSANQVGDILHASLMKPIKVGKNVVAPAGTDVYLRLVQVNSAGHFGGRSELRLELYRIVIQGTSYPLISNDYVDKGVSRTKRALLTILGSGAVGAAIGAIAGGGKGAAIGAAAGGGAGTIYQGATHGKAVTIAPEAKLKFKLEQPATVTLNPSAPQPLLTP